MGLNNSAQTNGSSTYNPSTYTVTISENAQGQLVMWPATLTLQSGDNMVWQVEGQVNGKQMTLTVDTSSAGIVITCSSCGGD